MLLNDRLNVFLFHNPLALRVLSATGLNEQLEVNVMLIFLSTLKCLNIGTPKNDKFPFVLNLKLIIFGCPKIRTHYSLIIMCSNIRTSKTINFPSGTNGKLMDLGVPILKHFRVSYVYA